jgi:hypothetical protein
MLLVNNVECLVWVTTLLANTLPLSFTDSSAPQDQSLVILNPHRP